MSKVQDGIVQFRNSGMKGLRYLYLFLQPVKSDCPVEGDDSLKEVQYERSPIMSTYLLAFVVGEYDYVEAKDADGVLIRVYTPVGKKEQGQFALDVSNSLWRLIMKDFLWSFFSFH